MQFCVDPLIKMVHLHAILKILKKHLFTIENSTFSNGGFMDKIGVPDKQIDHYLIFFNVPPIPSLLG